MNKISPTQIEFDVEFKRAAKVYVAQAGMTMKQFLQLAGIDYMRRNPVKVSALDEFLKEIDK